MGMTLKQFAALRFHEALESYREALRTGDSKAIVAASLAVYVARRSNADRAAINRVFRGK